MDRSTLSTFGRRCMVGYTTPSAWRSRAIRKLSRLLLGSISSFKNSSRTSSGRELVLNLTAFRLFQERTTTRESPLLICAVVRASNISASPIPLLFGPDGCRISSEPTSGAVVGNARSHIFEWPACPDYSSISPNNQVPFQSPQAAEAGRRAAGGLEGGAAPCLKLVDRLRALRRPVRADYSRRTY